MRVQPGEAQLRIGPQQRDRGRFVTRVNAELRIVAAGTHVRVRACVDPHVQAQDDRGAASFARDRGEPFELGEAVDRNESDTPPAGGAQLLVGFPRAVERNPLRWYAGALGGHQFTERTDVEPDRVTSEMADEFDRCEGFGGVRNLQFGRGGGPQQLGNRRVYRVEVDRKQRCVVYTRELVRCDSAEPQTSVVVALDQNCSVNASICVWATPAASIRAASCWTCAGGVTNINGALAASAARTVHH